MFNDFSVKNVLIRESCLLLLFNYCSIDITKSNTVDQKSDLQRQISLQHYI